MTDPTRKIRSTTTYSGVHSLVKQLRGPAKNYPCAECGDPAQDWAFNHEKPVNVMIDPMTGAMYSLDPDHYDPLCKRCHKRRDIRARAVTPTPMRKKNTGTLRRLPSGRWHARVWFAGKQVAAPATFDAKIDAEAWLARATREIAEGRFER